MKKSHMKLLALCLSASLCSSVFAGCTAEKKETLDTETPRDSEVGM